MRLLVEVQKSNMASYGNSTNKHVGRVLFMSVLISPKDKGTICGFLIATKSNLFYPIRSSYP